MNINEINSLTEKIIGIAINVHKELGPGLLEKVYQRCLKIALEENNLKVEAEVPVKLTYHAKKLPMKVLESTYWLKIISLLN